MRPIVLLFSIPLCLSLAACATRLCGTAEPGEPVYIKVGYADDGTPEVEPLECHVKAGVDITWRGPALDDTPFRLTFHGDPGTVTKGAEDRGRRMAARSQVVVESEGGLLRQEAGIKAENQGEYKYDVGANDRSLDPHIIIDR